MSEVNNDIEVRSAEVQDILSHMPNWLIRWGISVVLFIILILLAISWIIKYPDIVEGRATLTTHHAPVRLVAHASGELRTIAKNEDDWVAKGETVAEITSDLAPEDIAAIKRTLAQVDSVLKTDSTRLNISVSERTLGELQQDYHRLVKQAKEYQRALNDDHYQQTYTHLKHTIAYTEKLRVLSQKEADITKQELANHRIKYEGNQSLYANGGMAKFDFLNLESQFLQKKKQYQSHLKQLVEMDLKIENLKHDEFQLVKSHQQQLVDLKLTTEQGVQNLSNRIENWQRNYQVKAPIGGTLSYLTPLNVGEFVQSGTELFVLVPSDDSLIAHVYVQGNGVGKIKVGQMVRLKFSNYPHHEYGMVRGEVQRIAQIPNKSEYRVDVSLPQGLKSSFNMDLDFTPEMTAQGEIVVEDIRLIDRVFTNLRKILDK